MNRFLYTSLVFLLAVLFFVACKSKYLSYKEYFIEGYSSDNQIVEGNVESLTIKEYDPIITFGKPEIGQIDRHKEFMFNDKGDIVETKLYSSYSDELFSRTNISYDENGNLVSALSYDKDTLIWKILYQQEGNKLSEVEFNGNGKIRIKREYTLDNDNCVIEYTTSDKYLSINQSYSNKCNKGRVVESQSRSSNDKIVFGYDEKNRMISTSASYGLKITNRYLLEDSHGNWTRKEELRGDTVDKIIIRTFVYKD